MRHPFVIMETLMFLSATDGPIEKSVLESAPVTTGKETILLVDDEEIILETVVAIVKRLGYSVFTAQSGHEAVQVYSENKDKVDLVILDMIMPDMDGGMVFNTLKNINKKVKVLLSSGCSPEGQAKAIMARGCNGFIQKPFNIKNLSQKIRTILNGK